MIQKPYIATFRAQFLAMDEGEAMSVVDKFVDSMNDELDEGEAIELTQLTDGIIGDKPEELLVHLRNTRNALIRTKSRVCLEAARSIQEVIQMFEAGDFSHLVQFDYGRFSDIIDKVLGGTWVQ